MLKTRSLAIYASGADEVKQGTEFDRMIAWTKKMAENKVLKRSGREAIKLSREDEEKDNPLIEDAKQRAEQFRKQYRA